MSTKLPWIGTAFATAAWALAPGAVSAADNGFYFGASVGDVRNDDDWLDESLDQYSRTMTGDDRGFKLIGGIRPLDAIAIELDYVDFGTRELAIGVVCPAVVGFPCPDRASLDMQAVSASVVGLWALPLVDLFGRVGVARWESESEVRFSPASEESDTDLVYGVGAQVRVGSFALRVEYERFDWPRGDRDFASLGFTYTFL
jgi:hypothetical protein